MIKKYPIRPDFKGRTVVLPQRIGRCFWCGKDLSFDRRRISFCKNEHADAYYKRFVYEDSTKHQIFVKDDYKCIKCGFNVREFKAELEKRFPWRYGIDNIPSWKKRIKYIESLGFSTNQAYLEIDHIKPIKMGGDPLDINNQQTLCYPCHKKKTKKDVGQMAKMNRICKEIRGYWNSKKQQKKMDGYWENLFASK